MYFSKLLQMFIKLVNEPKLLLQIAKLNKDPRFNEPLLKSAVILSFAYWERFVEDLLSEGCDFIAKGLRNPNDLPQVTKEKIALFSINENREKNHAEFTNSVWSFAGEGWSDKYKEFVQKRIESINTPNIKNVKDAFFDVFGIRNVFDGFSTVTSTNEELMGLFNTYIEKRHKLVHGDSKALYTIKIEDIESWISIELKFVEHLEQMTWRQIAKITQKSAQEYGFKSEYIYQIVEYFKANGSAPVTNEVFQKISPTANSNYKKLGYAPWALLEIRNPKEIFPTQNMFAFIAGEVKLPSKIGVLRNQMAFPKEDTDLISYTDLQNQFQL